MSRDVPGLGNVTLMARAEDSVYVSKPGPNLTLLDPDGMDPTRHIAERVSGLMVPTSVTSATVQVD